MLSPSIQFFDGRVISFAGIRGGGLSSVKIDNRINVNLATLLGPLGSMCGPWVQVNGGYITTLRGADTAGSPQGLVPGQGSTALRDVDFGVIAQQSTIKLWMRKDGVDQAVQAFRYTPLRSLFRQYCSHVGLEASHVRFICGELLSPDDTPAQARLEDDHILDVVVLRGRG